MNKFMIITNSFKDNNLKVTNEIKEYLEGLGATCGYIMTDLGSEIIIPAENNDVECLIVLGGDGTFIHAVKRAVKLDIPVIGVNLGTLGYLCELEADNLKADLEKMVKGDYILENRMMLSGQVLSGDEKNFEDTAINDVVIHRGGNLRVLNFIIYVNGQHLYTYTADGIIIATPTGSTGYSMSAGGPIVEPQANLMVVTPINPHIFGGKSIILSDKDEIVVEIGEGRRKKAEKALVTFDGGESIEVSSNDRIVVKRAENNASIMRLQNQSFLTTLSRKMQKYT